MFRDSLCFDDVLMVPKYSEIPTREDVDLSSELDPWTLGSPILSSPMDSITEVDMAVSMAQHDCLGVIHRYNTLDQQLFIVNQVLSMAPNSAHCAAAVGVTGDFSERAEALVKAGVGVLCLDVAHGHHSLVKDALRQLTSQFGDDVHLMAGNVATLEGYECLVEWGADSVRVGIGGGSICTTRMVTGHGVPTFQSILDCARSSYNAPIIADGGIKTSGDCVKALAAGAGFVMLGSMLSETTECPGSIFTIANGEKHKVYRGMASSDAQVKWRGKASAPEGVSTTVRYRGGVKHILRDLYKGIQSGLSYSGCRNIKELQENVEWIRQTSSARQESSAHILSRG